MPTTVNIFGVPAPTAKLLRARVYNPDGTTNADIALTEEVNGSSAGLGAYNGSSSLTLADALADPYTYEVREVATQDVAGFNGATTVRRTKGVLGWVKSNVLLSDRYLDAAVSGGGESGSINTGNVLVTSDTGGVKNLIVERKNGIGIDGAQVLAYLTSEYNVDPNTAEIRGFAVTRSDGSWSDMFLDSGLSYMIFARGSDGVTYGPKTIQL